jgi:hypothetical protein
MLVGPEAEPRWSATVVRVAESTAVVVFAGEG